MKKDEFLQTLCSLLQPLPADERDRVLAFYEEMISDRMEDGQSEGGPFCSLAARRSWRTAFCRNFRKRKAQARMKMRRINYMKPELGI